MSVTTTCDEKIEVAKDCVFNAVEALNVVLRKDTWGNSEYTDIYLMKLNDIRHQLQDISLKLGN